MDTTSEVTIKDIWPKLCDLGLVELRINGYTVWSIYVMDCMFSREDYFELEADYRKRAEEKLLGDGYKSFRVTNIQIKIVGHHVIADVEGYFEDGNDSLWERGIWVEVDEEEKKI